MSPNTSQAVIASRRGRAIARVAALVLVGLALLGVALITVRLSSSAGVGLAVAALSMLTVGGVGALAVANASAAGGATRAAPAARLGTLACGCGAVLFFLFGVVLLVAGGDDVWFMTWLSAMLAMTGAVIGWSAGRDLTPDQSV